MKGNKLVTTTLQAPYPLKRGFPLTPRMVFLASLSVYVASSPVGANTAVDLPAAPGLDVDFRCVTGGDCPLGEDGRLFVREIDEELSLYLEFDAIDNSESCDPYSPYSPYTPFLTNELEGIGVECDADPSGLQPDQGLEIRVVEYDGEVYSPSSTSMTGINLSELYNGDGEGCFAESSGNISVFTDGPEGFFSWSADTTDDDDLCEVDNPHDILVDFGETLDVNRLRLRVFGSSIGNGVYAAGIATTTVSPGCFASQSGNCEIELINDNDDTLPGNDLKSIVNDPALQGNVFVAGGPYRVEDPRTYCWPGAFGSPEELEFNSAATVTYYMGNGTAIMAPLPLPVSTNPGPNWFKISMNECGTPRASAVGLPVNRNDPSETSWIPYIDIVAVGSDIDPVAGTVEWESEGLDGSTYECRDGELPIPTGGAPWDPTPRDQPSMLINALPDEPKFLEGTDTNPGTIDPVARDMTIAPCGSLRGGSRRFSYIAWNVIQAPEADMTAKIDAEIQVLRDTATRIRSCVDASFYRSQLAAYPRYIDRYFDYAVSQMPGNPARARTYFLRTAALVDQFQARLERPGVKDGFLQCFASTAAGSDSGTLDAITEGSGDKPLNAWGDIIAQLEHLSYALRAYVNLLVEEPGGPG